MDARLQRRIQRYGWDKAADAYEAGWKESLSRVQSELLRIAGAKPGERVLDLACGTGLVSFPLAEAVGPDGCVLASDISAKMVENVRHEAAARGLTQLTAFRTDAEDLDMSPDASVDLVTCALGLMYVADPNRTLSEGLRVLKTGGRAVFAVWGARSKCGWADIFPIVDARVKSEVCPLFFRLGTGSTLAQNMASAGFTDVHSVRLNYELPYEDDQAAIGAAFAGGPVALAYDRFDAPTRAEVHQEYLASINRFRTPQGYRVPGEFVVAWGHKKAEGPTNGL